MTAQVLTGAALVGAAIPLAWWGVSSERAGTGSSTFLQRGLSGAADLRVAMLERSARERAIAPALAALSARARRMTPAGMLASIERRLAAAGQQGSWSVDRILGAKVVLVLVGALLGFVRFAVDPSGFSLLLAGTVVALTWFAPDLVLRGRAAERAKSIQHDLADTIDQVTIAVEAGLGFEAAMARVAATGDSVLALELARMLQDIQLGVPRADALEHLADRCNVPELRHFVTAVRQAERYGLPIANVLRVQSGELREKRRQRAEEHAMKIPVKVLFPLVFCILPTLFIVVIGPGAIRIIENFSS